jgi:hypothetical protein
VEKEASLTHYTKIAHLHTIVGMKGQGLVLGGLTGKGDRVHLYATTAVPEKDGTLPNEYRRRGTDCMVSLDPVLMKEHYDLHMSANGTIMINKPVRIHDILRVTMLGMTRYTHWTRPTPRQMSNVAQSCCVCSMCNTKYPSGTIWCYGCCWMPLTWQGVHER